MIWEGFHLKSLLYKAISMGEALFSGDLRANYVVRKLKSRTLDLKRVRVRASWFYDVELQCSPEHRVITNNLDDRGKAVETLRPGDTVLFTVNGHVKRGRIREITAMGRAADVGTFTLYHGHIYCAGQVHYRSWVHRLLARFRRPPIVGILSHNVKSVDT
jgi:hypothetical protein